MLKGLRDEGEEGFHLMKEIVLVVEEVDHFTEEEAIDEILVPGSKFHRPILRPDLLGRPLVGSLRVGFTRVAGRFEFGFGVP